VFPAVTMRIIDELLYRRRPVGLPEPSLIAALGAAACIDGIHYKRRRQIIYGATVFLD
jgi:hypothetical protein